MPVKHHLLRNNLKSLGERVAGEELSPSDRLLVAESLKQALFNDLPGVGLPAR